MQPLDFGRIRTTTLKMRRNKVALQRFAQPPLVGGRGYTLIGRHEIMLPLLAQAVVEALGS